MIIRSSANISGRWSYLEEMYCVIASDSDTAWERRNGSCRILLSSRRVRTSQSSYLDYRHATEEELTMSLFRGVVQLGKRKRGSELC